jgi:hypothetical protein
MSKYPTIWGGGQLLTFSGLDGKTDFREGMCLRTSFRGYIFEIKKDGYVPRDPEICYIGGEPENVELTGDFFRLYSQGKISSGVLVDTHHILLEGEFSLSVPEQYFDIINHGNKTLLAVAGHLKKELFELNVDEQIAERSKFLNSVTLPDGISESARRTAIKALSQFKGLIYAPEYRITHYWTTPDRWPHKQMWLWDSVFHAIGMRHYNPALARDFISAMFDLQREDGFIPICGNPYSLHWLTQPPVLGLGMRLVNEIEDAPEWIAELAPKLARYIKWIMNNRDTDKAGLVEWTIEADENCRSGESGMDNSPRFDEAILLDAADFNAYLAMECEHLAAFLPQEREYWFNEHKRLCKLINERLWNEELGIYCDYDVETNRNTGVMASSGFLPMICGAPSQAQVARLAAHLTNTETFGTSLRVPSIPKCNTKAYSKDMWRGPSWAPVNYLIALGLRRYGYDDLAADIMRDFMHEQEKWYCICGSLFEYYDDRKEVNPRDMERKGLSPNGEYHPFHQVFHDLGWGATLYLEMLNHPEWR